MICDAICMQANALVNLCRNDDVTEIQDAGLDAPEDAAGQESTVLARLAWTYDQKLPASISIEGTRLGRHSSPTYISASI